MGFGSLRRPALAGGGWRGLAGWMALGAGLTAAATPPPSAADSLVIEDVRVYADPSRPMLDDAVILVEQGVIRAVGRRAEVDIPAGATVVDGQGAVAVAGFWNSHVHLTTPTFLDAEASDAALQSELQRVFTRWGFTTVFDLASTRATAGGIRARIASGAVAGPRILSVFDPFYPADGTPVYARPFYEHYGLPSAEVATPDAAVQRVRAQRRAGADGVKLFTGAILGEQEVAHMPPAIIAAAAAEARTHGQPVFAHPTDRKGLDRAVSGGVTVLAHAAPLMGPWSADDAGRLAKAGVAMVPTLSLYAASPHPLTPVQTAVQQAAALHGAGGTLLFGTDVGFTDDVDTRAELRLMHEAAGWRGVLASLTTAPAATFGEADTRGRLAPGFAADIVLVGGDPALDITHLADVRLVIRAGRVIFERDTAAVQPLP